MLKNLASVAGLTLLSRITGFFRDVFLGAMLGVGMLADAFYVAFRLPNHFRAIFGEGAFNAAYVPSYARVLEQQGESAAQRFAAQISSLLLLSQMVLLAVVWVFMPQVVSLLAPGFTAEPEKFETAITLARITFPYLLFITLVTLYAGTLNARGHFAAAAFAPVLLNLVMIACLALAFLFPTTAHAAAWGITISGALELVLLIMAARRANAPVGLAKPSWSADVKQFFTAFLPAVIGSAGVQIALFADTIIASLLPTGSVSAIYYADRIYQLPIGVIGIAAGTVLLPEMSRHLAAGDKEAAALAQNRTMAITLAVAAPFLVAFLMLPDLIMRGIFQRGAFTEAAAKSAAEVLFAYGTGLLAMVLIRSAVASFQAQGDTRTPMMISLGAVGINIIAKLFLYEPLGAAGLAYATALGAWINFALLVIIALKRGWMQLDPRLVRVCISVANAAFGLVLIAIMAVEPLSRFATSITRFSNELTLVLVGLAGAILYVLVLLLSLTSYGVPLWQRATKGQRDE